jgi:DNA-binding transcriptional ArsR family regulator
MADTVNIAETTELMDMGALEKAAECLRTIAHPCRLRIIEILLNEERSVGELAEACGIPSHMASEHLRLLKDRGLLKSRREGRKVYYVVAEPALAMIMNCVGKKFICKD